MMTFLRSQRFLDAAIATRTARVNACEAGRNLREVRSPLRPLRSGQRSLGGLWVVVVLPLHNLSSDGYHYAITRGIP